MNCKQINQLVKDMATLIKFHELETVDSRAVELLIQASEVENQPLLSENELDSWLEEIRVANMVETSR